MSEHRLSENGRSFAYNQRVSQLRKRASRIATQEQLNAILFLADEGSRRGIFEIMEPYLPFPCATCPDGPARDVVGN